LFERRKGKCFVELARLIILFRVGLGQLFVVFGLLRFPVGLSPFFVRAVVADMAGLGLSDQNRAQATARKGKL
jgi:hypothetical protein